MKTRHVLIAGVTVWFTASLAPMDSLAQFARVQLINASVDPAMETVDVYLDDVLWYDDFQYATAAAFTDVLEGARQLALAPASSASSAEAFKTLEMSLWSGSRYHAVLSGVMDPGQYPANPGGLDTSLKLYLGIGAQEASTEAGKFEFRAFHNLFSEGHLEFWIELESNPAFEVGGTTYGSFSPTYTDDPVDNSRGYIKNPDYVTRFYADGQVADLADTAFLELSVGFIGPETCTVPPTGLPQLQWLRIFADGTIQALDVLCSPLDTEAADALPRVFRLEGNYPNPFNPVTTVVFDLTTSATVRVGLFDLLGRRVLQVQPALFVAGSGQQIQIDASALGSGTYVYRVIAVAGSTTYTASGRMILLK